MPGTGNYTPIKQKLFKITLPDGNIVSCNSLTRFCKVHNLSYACMSKVVSGQTKSYQGYKVLRADTQQNNRKSNNLFIIKTPTGDVHTVDNLLQYCRDNGLSYSSMSKLSSGVTKQCKGYTCQRILITTGIANVLPTPKVELSTKPSTGMIADFFKKAKHRVTQTR